MSLHHERQFLARENVRYQAVWLVASGAHHSYGIVWSLTTFPLTGRAPNPGISWHYLDCL